MRQKDTSDSGDQCIDPLRLLAAADTILAAELTGGTVSMWRDDARPSRDGFSSLELVEGLVFLRRMGLIEDPRPIRHNPDPKHPR